MCSTEEEKAATRADDWPPFPSAPQDPFHRKVTQMNNPHIHLRLVSTWLWLRQDCSWHTLVMYAWSSSVRSIAITCFSMLQCTNSKWVLVKTRGKINWVFSHSSPWFPNNFSLFLISNKLNIYFSYSLKTLRLALKAIFWKYKRKVSKGFTCCFVLG